MRLSDLLRQCVELEDRIGTLYEQFESTFAEDAELKSFWSSMSEAERAHASSLHTAAVNPGAHQHSLDAGEFRLIRSYVNALTSWRPPSTVDESLRTALDLEELELDCVRSALLRIAGAEASEDVVRDDDEHVELLLRMIERRATAERLRKRAAAHRERRRDARADLSVSGLLAGISRRICHPRLRD